MVFLTRVLLTRVLLKKYYDLSLSHGDKSRKRENKRNRQSCLVVKGGEIKEVLVRDKC